MPSAQVQSGLLMGFGSAAVIGGAVMAAFWPTMFLTQLRNMMVLTPYSESFEIWRETPLPMYLECFFFNVTNVDDILAGKNVSIQVEQLGPYVYREVQKKVNITWNDNGTVTFFNERSWYYEPGKSNGSLSDILVSVNPIIATTGYMMRHQHPIVKVTLDVFIRMFHDSIFVRAPISDWLFDGIDDPMGSIAEHFPDMPIDIPHAKFGWFYGRNGSMEFDGIFLMETGAKDFSRIGNMMKWKYSNRTIFRDECGEVRGSSGDLWAPEHGQPEITLFAADICTYMNLAANGTVGVAGLEGTMFAANSSLFDNGHRYPKMACYCDEVRDENCVPAGALNVSACRYGAPVFVSQPHFYNMDPYYPSKIEGLNPTDDMNFKMALEMTMGVPLQVAAQLQINLLIRHVTGFTINNQLPDPDTMVPMFWFRQEVQMDDENAALVRFALNLKRGLLYGFYALTAIGGVLVIVGIIILVRKLL